MTPAMIAAQEQRLARIAEIHRVGWLKMTLSEYQALEMLAACVRRDATLHGGTFRRHRGWLSIS